MIGWPQLGDVIHVKVIGIVFRCRAAIVSSSENDRLLIHVFTPGINSPSAAIIRAANSEYAWHWPKDCPEDRS